MPENKDPKQALSRLAEDFTVVNDRLKQLNRECEDFVDTLVALAKGAPEGAAAVKAYEEAINKTGEAKTEEDFDKATGAVADSFSGVLSAAEKADAGVVAKYRAATGEIESILTTYEQVALRIEEVVQ